MASPFRLFRKHLKPLLVIFTVLLILAWLGGGALTGYMGGSQNSARKARQDARAVAVRWDGGSLTNQQVYDLVIKRRMLNAFLQQVEMEGRRKSYEAQVDPSPLRVQMLVGPDNQQQGVERSVVETRLFADAAREAGMRISDETIVQYLDQLGRGNVSRPLMRDILKGMQSRVGRVSIDDIMGALREEMLAQNYINSNRYAFLTVTPEQRWKDWLCVNDHVVVEAAAIPAESFLVDVKEPTEAELTEFFDKYKDREASPELVGTTELPSATPGFRIPRKIDLQFIEANYDSFLAKTEEKITDEEIAKYYESHKDPMFIKAETDLMEDKGEKKDAAKPESTATPEAKGTNEAQPNSDAVKLPEGESKAAPAEGKATEGEKPATPGAGNSPPPADEGKGDAAAKDAKQSSLERRVSKSPFRLTAFLQTADKDGAAADSAAKTDSSTATETKAADAAAKPADTTPAAAPAAPAPPAAPDSTPPAAGATPPSASVPAAPAAAGATPPAPKKPPEFQPLEQVKDVIRRRLAEDKVAEQLTRLATDIVGELDAQYTKYYTDVLNAKADKQAPPALPKSLIDLAPLAEKNGLKSGATGPVSYLQLRDAPIGKSAVVDSDTLLRNVLFFTKKYDLYQPLSTVDIDGNHFIVMTKSDTPGRVPTLAEVRDEVVKAWKAQNAAELAEKHAQELAKKAQDAKSPLTTYFADDKTIKVVRTDPFSELTGGDVGIVNGQLQRQPYRLGQPDGIVAPGPDFMKEVFRLKDGDVGAALNHDHTIAYVIRLVEHQPPLAELRTAYLAEANSWPGLTSMVQGHAQEVAASLEADLKTGSNLSWERDPDQVEQAESPEAG